jgi:hypothetical protein
MTSTLAHMILDVPFVSLFTGWLKGRSTSSVNCLVTSNRVILATVHTFHVADVEIKAKINTPKTPFIRNPRSPKF